ncbi:MAG: C25 family cysteine peptidase [Terriglobales bacterium]
MSGILTLNGTVDVNAMGFHGGGGRVLTNNGATNTGNTTFKITVPANTTYVSTTDPGGGCTCSDFDDSGYEQIATGRLPVRTLADANTVVSKLLAYEAQSTGTWSSTAYLVANQNVGADF